MSTGSNLWDNHMHSHFSGDSDASMEDMIQSARSSGLQGITFTDHLDLDYLDEPHLFDLDIDKYLSALTDISMRNNDDHFTVLHGIEIGLQPHLAYQHAKLLSRYHFDYVIGSSHVVDSHDPYYPAYFESLGVYSGIRRYYESILENLNAFHNIDAYGHLDYIIRYLGNAPQATRKAPDGHPYSYDDFRELIDTVLQELIRYDIALEVNTGAYRSGLCEPNPACNIIRRYHELGGKLITLGADAHEPEHVALGYSKVPSTYAGSTADFRPINKLLEYCGFHEFAVFKDREPVFYPL